MRVEERVSWVSYRDRIVKGRGSENVEDVMGRSSRGGRGGRGDGGRGDGGRGRGRRVQLEDGQDWGEEGRIYLWC